MNTVFGGNQVGGRVELDIAGSYPTGLMAALGTSYNDPQELINAQLRYTAAFVDITSGQDAGYALRNTSIENSGILSPTSLLTQVAAITYRNASSEVNYANQNVSNNANVAYTNAHAVYKACEDASYMAFIVNESAQIVLDRISTATAVVMLGNTPPGINAIDRTTLDYISSIVGKVDRVAQNNVSKSHINATNQQNKLLVILNNAIVKSSTVTNNLTLVAAFNSLVKVILKNINDPLLSIAGKEDLVTQYVPSVPLNNAINVANLAVTCINNFISALESGLQTSASITASVAASAALATSLDSIARANDITMYLKDATADVLIQTTSTMKVNGSQISIPSGYPYTAEYVSESAISAARAAKNVALPADISASNARAVSNALNTLKQAFASNRTPEPMIAVIANSSLKMLMDTLNTLAKVTNNSSSYSAVAITKRASNTIVGYLARITQDESISLEAAGNANDVLKLLNTAILKISAPDSLQKTQDVLWAVNAAKGRAHEVSEKAKDVAFILSRTAHNLVTPQRIAIQTAGANRAGAINNNLASRLDRNSRSVPVDPPPAYKSFKADIRAKTFQPIRPSLDELVFKNRITPLRLDSLRTIMDTNIKVAEEVQRIYDTSAFSFRQQ